MQKLGKSSTIINTRMGQIGFAMRQITARRLSGHPRSDDAARKRKKQLSEEHLARMISIRARLAREFIRKRSQSYIHLAS